MLPLATAVALVLHLGGVSGDLPHVYAGAGQAAVLPCGAAASSSSTCSTTSWYFRRAGRSTPEVESGEVVQRSARGSRISLTPNCSLVLTNLAAEDAGLYHCAQGAYRFVFISVLQITQQPEPQREDALRLECSVWGPTELGPCPWSRLRWLNQTGAVLQGLGGGSDAGGGSGEDEGSDAGGGSGEDEGSGEDGGNLVGGGPQADVQAVCSTFLTVPAIRQPQQSSKYTCQLLDEQDRVKAEVEYTPHTGSGLWFLIYSCSRMVGLVLLVGVTAAVSRTRNQPGTNQEPSRKGPK